MAKRLTAAELGVEGEIDSNLKGRKVLIEATILPCGPDICDLRIGNDFAPQLRNSAIRRAVIEAEMTEPMGRRPVAYLRDLDGTGSLHVCAAGDPGAVAVYSK